jgi:thiol-disulfide isomerase/thioredoxin
MSRYSLILVGLIGVFGWSGVASLAPENDSVVARLLDGSTYDVLDAGLEEPVLLKFWATWCVVCLKEMPAYVELYENYGERVRFLAVNVAVSDPRDRVRSAVDQFGLSMPVAYDQSGDLWDRFDIIGTPTYVLLGSDGTVLHRTYGHDDSLESALDSAIARPVRSAGQVGASSSEQAIASPALTAVDIDGNIVDLDAADGEVLVGYHFAIWCASYVRESYVELSKQCQIFDERIQQLRDAGLPHVRLIGFVSAYSTDEASAVRFRDKRHIDEPIIFDSNGAYAAKFGARSFPHITVVAPGGRTVYAGSQIPENIQQLIRNEENHGL